MPELLSIFLNILTPVFALVAIGYFFGPRLQFETRTLSRFAYFLLTPAFLFNVLSGAEIPAALAARMALFMLTVAIAGILIAWLVARGAGCTKEILAAHILVAAFGNVGNFGLPIIQFKFGDGALVPASFYFLVLSTFGFIVGVTAANWYKGTGWGAALSVIKTPAIIAAVLAFPVNWFDVPVPIFAQRGVALLAGAMIPTMLIALGVQLAGMGRPKLSRDVILASVIRLVAGPVLAMLLVVPFGLSGVERGAGILQASMPAAVLAALIAMEHNLVPDFVTTAVLFSTLASALTLTVVLAVV